MKYYFQINFTLFSKKLKWASLLPHEKGNGLHFFLPKALIPLPYYFFLIKEQYRVLNYSFTTTPHIPET